MQPQMGVVLGISQGTSTITESIFENRFKYVDELAKMGANIKVESNIAIIYEPPLINIIKFACHSCPEKRVFVSNGCCLLYTSKHPHR